MKELSVMNPTATDRRHFMLISDDHMDLTSVESVILKSGYQQSDSEESEYVNANSRIALYSSSGLIGGTILPPREICENIQNKADRISLLSKLFQVLFVAFIAEWLIAILVFDTGLSYVITYLGFVIPLTFFLFLLLASLFVVYFFRLDNSAATINQDTARKTLNDILPAFEASYPDIKITRMNVVTKRGERGIVRHLPKGFVDSFSQLGIHDMENRFWNF